MPCLTDIVLGSFLRGLLNGTRFKATCSCFVLPVAQAALYLSAVESASSFCITVFRWLNSCCLGLDLVACWMVDETREAFEGGEALAFVYLVLMSY